MNPSNFEGIEQFRTELLGWGEDNLRDFPWREPDSTPYEILIAEVFLKQTRSSTVAGILPKFLDNYPDPESLQEADIEDLVELIRPLGLYNHRSRALKEIGERLAGSSFPQNEEEMMELPQVGRYVSNATLCFGFGQARPILDSNVERVYSRIFKSHLPDSPSKDRLWSLAESILPEGNAERYNSALLDFGATICTDSSPCCERCFASDYCDYYSQRDASAP